MSFVPPKKISLGGPAYTMQGCLVLLGKKGTWTAKKTESSKKAIYKINTQLLQKHIQIEQHFQKTIMYIYRSKCLKIFCLAKE